MCSEIASVLYQIESLPLDITEKIEIIRFEDIWEKPNQFSQLIQEISNLKQNKLLDEYLYDQFRKYLTFKFYGELLMHFFTLQKCPKSLLHLRFFLSKFEKCKSKY